MEHHMSENDKQQVYFKAVPQVVQEEDKVKIQEEQQSRGSQWNQKETKLNIFLVDNYFLALKRGQHPLLALQYSLFWVWQVSQLVCLLYLIILRYNSTRQLQALTITQTCKSNLTGAQNTMTLLLCSQFEANQDYYCLFHHSPDGLVTVQQCGESQNFIVYDEKVEDLSTELDNNPAKVLRILAEDDSLVDLNEQLQQDILMNGEHPQISSQEFVQIDNNGNLVAGQDGNRRILRFRLKKINRNIMRAVSKAVDKTVNSSIQLAKKAAPYIGAAVGFIVAGPAGMCAGFEIGQRVQTALSACFPNPQNSKQSPQFKCSAQVYNSTQLSKILKFFKLKHKKQYAQDLNELQSSKQKFYSFFFSLPQNFFIQSITKYIYQFQFQIYTKLLYRFKYLIMKYIIRSEKKYMKIQLWRTQIQLQFLNLNQFDDILQYKGSVKNQKQKEIKQESRNQLILGYNYFFLQITGGKLIYIKQNKNIIHQFFDQSRNYINKKSYMSSTDKQQAEFKAVTQEDNKVDIKDELPYQKSIEELEGNQNKKFSCKQFLFGTQKRTALSICFTVFSLLGVAGFIVGMLIVSGDIKIQQHQIVTGFDGKQYNYTNMQVKPAWSLQYNDFIVMQPIVDKSRILQQVEIQSDCFFHHSPDGLVTVQQCGESQNVIVNDEQVDNLAQNLNNNPALVRRILAGDDLVDLNDQFQQDILIDGQNPQITSQEFVQIDNNGNLVAGVGGNRRILRFKFKKLIKSVAKAVTKVINTTVNVAVKVAKVAAPLIGAAVGLVLGGPAGMCLGLTIGSAVQIASQACIPNRQEISQSPQFRCSLSLYNKNKPPAEQSLMGFVQGQMLCPGLPKIPFLNK
ncbi:hypothetical protein pb186bvf_016405 [Paramecium bursaria]